MRENRGQVYAHASQSRPIPWLARVPQAPCIGHLGLRLFLRPNRSVPLHVFFVVRHANREILHAEVTRHPTADWAGRSRATAGGIFAVLTTGQLLIVTNAL
jgi:hypothetical protein